MALVASACTSASTSVGPTPAKCQVSLATPTPAVNAEGGNGSVAVTTGRECSWSVSSQATWITIASQASGQGDGTIEYRVSANLEPVGRKGAIAVNDQRAEITQAAGPCQFTIAPASQAIADTGGTASVAVTAASNCAWTAESTESWITITGGSGGTGSGTVNFTVAANAPGTSRSGTLTVAGRDGHRHSRAPHSRDPHSREHHSREPGLLVLHQPDFPVSGLPPAVPAPRLPSPLPPVAPGRPRAGPPGSPTSRRAAALGTEP